MASVGGLLERIYEGHVVDGADVARVTGSHPRTVARWQADAAVPRRDAEERILELKAVVDLLRRVMRDDAARVWLRTPNPDLDYEKPLDLIARGDFHQVISLVLAIAEGVTA
jgi:uncharacterized protein (DUF2384 family)